jgi:hypothetical protein
MTKDNLWRKIGLLPNYPNKVRFPTRIGLQSQKLLFNANRGQDLLGK